MDPYRTPDSLVQVKRVHLLSLHLDENLDMTTCMLPICLLGSCTQERQKSSRAVERVGGKSCHLWRLVDQNPQNHLPSAKLL